LIYAPGVITFTQTSLMLIKRYKHFVDTC